jgi:hypothetical protein
MRLRTLNAPRPANVRVDGLEPSCPPISIDGASVEFVRETWLLEDAWWTEHPLRRRYWEVLSDGGRAIVVFHDLCSGRWFTQVG